MVTDDEATRLESGVGDERSPDVEREPAKADQPMSEAHPDLWAKVESANTRSCGVLS
ncbi:hypothetical protein [Streptomyces sp. NPDC051214]|uniref:hypothetical protein n=1 Tax=Streptomyces sp. NPDC051214 TaxID=3155282 RepID=UPI00344641B6